jgi:hypothetical protein
MVGDTTVRSREEASDVTTKDRPARMRPREGDAELR